MVLSGLTLVNYSAAGNGDSWLLYLAYPRPSVLVIRSFITNFKLELEGFILDINEKHK